jgi:two-component system response regulator FixJ
MAPNEKPIVCVVDDEVAVHKTVMRLLRGFKVQVITFTSPQEFLTYFSDHNCHLLIVDFKMPEMDGLELLQKVKAMAPWLQTIMITGFGDVPLAVKALKMGACDFLEKPLEREVFLASVKKLLEQLSNMNELIGQPLSKKERHILTLTLSGQSSREIADQLDRSTRTIELHRQHIMYKMGVKNTIGLFRRANAMGLHTTDRPQASCPI